MTGPCLLSVEDLWVAFDGPKGAVGAVNGVSFSMGREKLGIVGESGSGKSTLARALLRLVPPPGRMRARRIALEGADLLGLSEKAMRAIRGRRISMVPQDPGFAFNPVMRVGRQIAEVSRLDRRVSAREADRRALGMLDAAGLGDPARVFAAFPHELSGGMAQRAMIAMMLIAGPDLLIADEPTSALDVSLRLKVLAMLDRLVSERGMGLVFISHDLDLVASFCDRVLVMYGGRILEVCQADELGRARHPYTRALLAARPRIEGSGAPLPVLRRDPAWGEPPGPGEKP